MCKYRGLGRHRGCFFSVEKSRDAAQATYFHITVEFDVLQLFYRISLLPNNNSFLRNIFFCEIIIRFYEMLFPKYEILFVLYEIVFLKYEIKKCQGCRFRCTVLKFISMYL